MQGVWILQEGFCEGTESWWKALLQEGFCEGTESWWKALFVSVFAPLHQCEEKLLTTAWRLLQIICDCWKNRKTVSKKN